MPGRDTARRNDAAPGPGQRLALDSPLLAGAVGANEQQRPPQPGRAALARYRRLGFATELDEPSQYGFVQRGAVQLYLIPDDPDDPGGTGGVVYIPTGVQERPGPNSGSPAFLKVGI